MLETKTKKIKTSNNVNYDKINKFTFLKSQKLLKDLNVSLSKEVINERRNSK
jgi:hypothetical protein